MYIFVRTRSDPIELVQVGLLDLVQYSFVVVAVIALAGRIDLFFQCVVEIRLRDLAFASQRSYSFLISIIYSLIFCLCS